jgi:beta-glucanase (GH16 family)
MHPLPLQNRRRERFPQLFVFFAFFLGLCLSLPAQAAGWKTVFRDDFSGSALNGNTWATRYIYTFERLDHLNDELELYRDNNNHIVRDGALSLVANPVGDRFESGLIRSRQTFYYGYFETRVRLPKGRGIWPAFWLNSDYDADGKTLWPPEIDVFEYVVNGIDDRANMFHSGAHPAVKQTPQYDFVAPTYNTRIGDYVGDKDLNDGTWHRFGLLWLKDTYTVYFDGVKQYTQHFDWTYADGRTAAPAHLLLNFAVGGKWAGRYGIDNSAFPQSLDIDYVLVCQFSPGATAGQCPTSVPLPDLTGRPADYTPGDLPKPVLTRDAVAFAGPPQAGTQVTLTAGLDGSLPRSGPYNLFLGVRPMGQTTIAQKQIFPLQTGNQLNGSLKLKAGLAPGDYELVAGVANAPEGTVAIVANMPTGEMLIPLTCQTRAQTAPKSLLCVMATFTVK